MTLPLRFRVIPHAERSAAGHRGHPLFERRIVTGQSAAAALAVIGAPLVIGASSTRARHEDGAHLCNACQRFHDRSPLGARPVEGALTGFSLPPTGQNTGSSVHIPANPQGG